NGSQIKFEDINQIDEDDMEEMEHGTVKHEGRQVLEKNWKED
nr:hypothetical protein [Tanacetum cinerariifolium]